MSFIVKGIDLPREGKKIMHIYADGTIIEHLGDGAFSSLTQSQAIQIPKGHGRLIDIEKLKEEFAMKNNICNECDSFKNCDNKTYSKSEICEKFIWVPTILEAEE